MDNVTKFANAIREASLPKNDEILKALAREYSGRNRGTLDNMADSWCKGKTMSRVFVDGFQWSTTPEGKPWWHTNVRRELEERGL